ncbi:hypothetical protein AURDEDRAFT_176994 [Auricularia subglabra TFB-10046 SS5]|uniref:Uncharacterized protein n=1 Tax=Auricularia subglabra (strain TFB-10046 / SS5) TaxID=717982 RepID=J0LBX6_AURST|nr:hypothetical protein AURDEDRAFT_176994 [Auricularia subglabra TFB-10046 SS5]
MCWLLAVVLVLTLSFMLHSAAAFVLRCVSRLGKILLVSVLLGPVVFALGIVVVASGLMQVVAIIEGLRGSFCSVPGLSYSLYCGSEQHIASDDPAVACNVFGPSCWLTASISADLPSQSLAMKMVSNITFWTPQSEQRDHRCDIAPATNTDVAHDVLTLGERGMRLPLAGRPEHRRGSVGGRHGKPPLPGPATTELQGAALACYQCQSDAHEADKHVAEPQASSPIPRQEAQNVLHDVARRARRHALLRAPFPKSPSPPRRPLGAQTSVFGVSSVLNAPPSPLRQPSLTPDPSST